VAPDNTGNPISIVGDFIPETAGSGSFASGSFEDINDGGTFTTKGSISGGGYATDTTNLGTGRGTATIGIYSFVYYVIDSQHAVFMGTDADTENPGTILGEAVAQTGAIPILVSSFSSSSFVFVMGGTGGSGPLARAGRLTANGATLSAVLLDNNNGGTEISVPSS